MLALHHVRDGTKKILRSLAFMIAAGLALACSVGFEAVDRPTFGAAYASELSPDPEPAITVAGLRVQATRPADSTLFDALQADGKSLAWRVTDGKFRATSRTGTASDWEADVRDAVWRALFATTQGSPPDPNRRR